MKTNQIIICILFFIVACTYGQYGSRNYYYNNSYLTSAKTIKLNGTGFVMAGVIPSASGTQYDFVVHRADAAGQVGGAGTFSEEYRIEANVNSCNNPLSKNHGCTDIDIVEADPNGPGTEEFALAAIATGGVFFATLDGAGVVINHNFWRVPPGTMTRVRIRASIANPGEYYICGDYQGVTYVIKTDYTANSGGPLWKKLYNNMPIEANDLIESPYNSNELIVVGRCDPGGSPAVATEAFFLRLNATNGNVIAFTCYSDLQNGDEWFNSIEEAVSTTWGNGFILGGHMHSSDPNYAGYVPWMIKLDPIGNPIWSTVIQGSEQIFDVIERKNGVTSPFLHEYYGIAKTPGAATNDMTVWKLDDVGSDASFGSDEILIPFGSTGSGYDYTFPQVEFLGDGTGGSDGFQAFATDYSTSDFVMYNSFYNGINNTGCQSRTDMSTMQGPGISIQPNLTSVTFFSHCIYNLINQNSTGMTHGTYCGSWISNPIGGSNARNSIVSGLDNHSAVSDILRVYPNPTENVLHIEVMRSTNCKVILSNSLGQIIKTFEVNQDIHSSEVTIDFENSGVAEGLYFVGVDSGHEISTQKVMFKK